MAQSPSKPGQPGSGANAGGVGADRRSFLKLSLMGGAGVMLGFPLVRVGLWWNRRPGDGLKALSDHEFRIVEAMAEAMFPPGGVLPQSGKELNAAMFVDEQVAAMNEDLQRVMKAGLHALEDMTVVDDMGLVPFSARSLEEREVVLQAWERSEVFAKRGLLRVYKWYICMALCEHPGVLEALDVQYLCG